MDALEEFKQTYFQECDELLGDLETHLMALQEGTTEVETLHAAFRAIHSIKGGAGAFGFDRLVSFSHTFETVLDLMRAGKVELSEDCVATAVRAGDIVADLVTAARTGEEPAAGFETEILEALSAIAGADASPAGEAESDEDEIEFTPIAVNQEPESRDDGKADEAEAASPTRYRIVFRPTTEMFNRAHEPLNFVRELKTLGALTTTADVSNLPPFAELDAEAAYLSWCFELETAAGLDSIEEVFEFVADDCVMVIEALADGGEAEAAAEQPAADSGADSQAGNEEVSDAPASPDAQAEPAVESARGPIGRRGGPPRPGSVV